MNLQPRILYPARLSFKFDGEIKSFPDKQKLREFSTTKPALQKMLKELLQAGNTREGKDLQKRNLNLNYLKCKWIKFANEKTQTGWADENICMYALPLTTSLCLTPRSSCMQLFYIVKFIQVHFMACNYNYLFFFWSGY